MNEGKSYLAEYECGNRAYRANQRKFAGKCPYCGTPNCSVVWILNEATEKFEYTKPDTTPT